MLPGEAGVIVAEYLKKAREKSQLPPSQDWKTPSYENKDSGVQRTSRAVEEEPLSGAFEA